MYQHRPAFFREDLPSGRRVDAKVKWFDAVKGFGFVTLADGSPDALLPMAALRRAGYEDLREGASVSCEVSARAKGPLVTVVFHVDSRTAVVPAAGRVGIERRGPRPSTTVAGTVKWFEADKGFGFITPDGGGKDVFVHVTALRRSGVAALDPGRRVRVETVDGKKGLEAERVILM